MSRKFAENLVMDWLWLVFGMIGLIPSSSANLADITNIPCRTYLWNMHVQYVWLLIGSIILKVLIRKSCADGCGANCSLIYLLFFAHLPKYVQLNEKRNSNPLWTTNCLYRDLNLKKIILIQESSQSEWEKPVAENMNTHS